MLHCFVIKMSAFGEFIYIYIYPTLALWESRDIHSELVFVCQKRSTSSLCRSFLVRADPPILFTGLFVSEEPCLTILKVFSVTTSLGIFFRVRAVLTHLFENWSQQLCLTCLWVSLNHNSPTCEAEIDVIPSGVEMTTTTKSLTHGWPLALGLTKHTWVVHTLFHLQVVPRRTLSEWRPNGKTNWSKKNHTEEGCFGSKGADITDKL